MTVLRVTDLARASGRHRYNCRVLEIGLNPYGVAFTVGLQAAGTERANPQPAGLDGFIGMAGGINARCIELDWRWLTPRSTEEIVRLRDRLQGMTRVCSFWLQQREGETLEDAVRCAKALGAALVRLHLTPVLEGARAACGPRWRGMVDHGRKTIRREAGRAAEAGLALAIENHQDFGSEELLEIAQAAGPAVGIVLDTGNPFAVGEDPVAFAARVAPLVRHVHLKDYRAQFTNAGYRLVRCAVGDGCVPLGEMVDALSREGPLTASIELGALEARHIRLFDRGWWTGYPVRQASELATALGRLQRHALGPTEDFRTPWERGDPAHAIVEYELGQLRKSVDYLRAIGWMSTPRGDVS